MGLLIHRAGHPLRLSHLLALLTLIPATIIGGILIRVAIDSGQKRQHAAHTASMTIPERIAAAYGDGDVLCAGCAGHKAKLPSPGIWAPHVTVSYSVTGGGKMKAYAYLCGTCRATPEQIAQNWAEAHALRYDDPVLADHVRRSVRIVSVQLAQR